MEAEEFYYALIIYGGLGLLSLLVIVVLGMWALKLRSERKIKLEKNKQFNEKERKNGKAGSHGHW